MFEAYKRWRHSRGFGIHSPSAYRLIREVLRPSGRYGYYAYAALRRLASDRREFSEFCMVYRLLVDLQPASIAVAGSPKLAQVARLAFPERLTNAASDAAFAIVADTQGAAPAGRGGALFCGDGINCSGEFICNMSDGHVFLGPRHVLCLPNPKRPFQTFTLNF